MLKVQRDMHHIIDIQLIIFWEFLGCQDKISRPQTIFLVKWEIVTLTTMLLQRKFNVGT